MLKNNKEHILLFLIFLISMCIRILCILKSASAPEADERNYIEIAQSLLNGAGFSIGGKPTSVTTPIYPLFLSLSFYLFGQNLFYAQLFQALLNSLICIPLFILTKHIFKNTNIALLASFLVAINLSTIFSTIRFLTESLFPIFFLTFLTVFIISEKKVMISMAGVLLGLATLTRPVTILLPIFIIFFLVLTKEYKKLLFFPFLILTILPWTIRNYFVHHEFVPLTTQTGNIVYDASHPVEDKIFGFRAPQDDVMRQANQMKSETEKNNFLLQMGIKSIQNAPLKYMKLAFSKFLFFWVPFDWEVVRILPKRGEFNFSYAFVMPFFILCMFSLFSTKDNKLHHRKQLFVAFVLCYFVFFSSITYGSPRLRLPLEPLLILFASHGIYIFFKSFNRYTSSVLLLSFYFLNFHIFLKSAFYKEACATMMNRIGLW